MPSDTDVVRANNAAFNRRDLDGMIAFYAPDALVTDKRHLGAMGDHRGHPALRAYYGSIFDNTAEINEDLEVLAASEGTVAVACRTVAGLPSDIGSETIELAYGMVLKLRGGLIQTLEIYDSGDAALAASELAPRGV